MFLFIGGIQPRTVRLDREPGICPSCGRMCLSLKRIDHYLSIFFIPLFRIRRGDPFLACDNCAKNAGRGRPDRGDRPAGRKKCGYCGEKTSPDYLYCPYCGKGL